MSVAFAADDPKPSVDVKPAQPTNAARPSVQYKTDPDSLPQEGVPKGKLEGPFIFKSQIFSNTVRKYWVFVPAQLQGRGSPHYYSDLHATILHQLGLNHKKMEVVTLGRTMRLVEEGRPIKEIIG